MHYGIVTGAYDLGAGVTLTVLADNGAAEHLDFLIDTGFYGELTLSQDVVDRLALTPGADKDVELALAGGSTRNADLYTARVLWHGRSREVEVVCLETEFLIGMGLLRGSNLSVDATPGGAVVISELPTSH